MAPAAAVRCADGYGAEDGERLRSWWKNFPRRGVTVYQNTGYTVRAFAAMQAIRPILAAPELEMRRAQLSEAIHSIKRYAGLSPREEPKTLRTFANLRFKGDRLAPSRVTDILNTLPTLAYRTGEVYKRDQGQVVRGLTNLWLLSSEERVNSADLNEHLDYLLAVLYPPCSDEPVKRLQNVIRESQVEADVGCFWYGARGARRPIISERVRNAFERLPARIELDFDTD